MAILEVEGSLDLPLTSPSSKTQLRFTRADTSGVVLTHAPEQYVTNADGTYAFSLHTGNYYVDVVYAGKWQCIGYIEIPLLAETPTTLGFLIDTYKKPIPGTEPVDPTDPEEPTDWPDERLNELAEKVLQNEADIADIPDLTEEVVNNTENIAFLEARIDGNTELFSEMDPRITLNSEGIEANIIRMDNFDVLMSELSVDIAELEQDIIINKDNIEGVKGAIITNANNIALNKQEIESFQSDIDILDGRTTENAEAIAENAEDISALSDKNYEQDIRLTELETRATLVGYYDAEELTYTTLEGDVNNDLPAAADSHIGDYIIVTADGQVSSQNAPELHDLYVYELDAFLAGTTQWIYSPIPTNYLSSADNDVAEGHLTFKIGASSDKVPEGDTEVIRKLEHDQLENRVLTNETAITDIYSQLGNEDSDEETQNEQIVLNTLGIESNLSAISNLTEETTTLRADVDSNTADIDFQGERISQAEISINELQTSDIEQDGRLDALEAIPLGVYFAHNYVFGDTVTYNTMVAGNGWLTICNNPAGSSDNGYPIEDGSPVFAAPQTPTWATESHTAIVQSGQTYYFTSDGWVHDIRFKANGLSVDHHHYIVINNVTDPANPIQYIEELFPITSTEWSTAKSYKTLVTVGSVIEILYLHDVSAETTEVTGGWGYNDTGFNLGPLGTGEWTRNRDDEVAIHITDLDSGNRQTELMGMTVGTTLRFVDTVSQANYREYLVTDAPFLNGMQVEYQVALLDSGGTINDTNTCTVSGITPTSQPTNVEYVTDYWIAGQPSWGTCTGVLKIGGVEQSRGNDLFGIDIAFQKLTASPDFTILSGTF